MYYFPVSLNIVGRLCVVVGGGRVAERKVKGLLTCEARVKVISPDLTEELARLKAAGAITWLERSYLEGDLAGAFLVIAATNDSDVQSRVHKEADGRNILLNIADVPRYCNFILPATIRRGDLTIAIGTGGKSPALAKHLRMSLESGIGTEYEILVDILGSIRPGVLAGGRLQTDNDALFKRLINQDMLGWIRDRNWRAVEEHVTTVMGDEAGRHCLAAIKEHLNHKSFAAAV